VATTEGSNYGRLEAVGVIYADLPDAHRAVVDALSEQEVQTLLDVYERLTEADVSIGRTAQPGELPPFGTEMVF